MFHWNDLECRRLLRCGGGLQVRGLAAGGHARHAHHLPALPRLGALSVRLQLLGGVHRHLAGVAQCD